MKEARILGYQMIVQGFKKVNITNINAFFDAIRKETKSCQIQFFDAKMIAGFDHLYFAVLNAIKAFNARMNISKKIAVETLLYASGQHQISKAIDLLGIKMNSSQIAVLVIADTRRKALSALDTISKLVHGERCDEVIELTDKKVEIMKAAFGITDLEIEATLRTSDKEALSSLLIERAALLATQS